MIVYIEQTENGKGLELPIYATIDSAGMDLKASISDTLALNPNQRVLIGCGFRMALPSPGTVDADYRGEIKVLLINFGESPFIIERGMRIAQLVIAPVLQIKWQETNSLDDQISCRGGGFGSTGLF